MFDTLDKENFNKVQRKCLENLNVVGGLSLSVDVEDKVENARNLGDLFKIMCRRCRPYWNWMNIRILEKMAGNSLAAKRLIDEYKKKVYSKKLKDVISEISDLEIPADKYTEVKEKWKKDFNEVLIGDIVKRWNEIEKKLGVEKTMLLKSVTEGCVEICWLVPNDLVDHAIHSATSGHPVCQSAIQEQVKDDYQLVTQVPVKDDNQSAPKELFPEVLHLKIVQEQVKDDYQLVTQVPVKNDNQSAAKELFPEVLHLKIGDVIIINVEASGDYINKDESTSKLATCCLNII